MKILRLAYFNIRKHRLEAASLFLLLMLCMTLAASAFSGITQFKRIFDDAFDRTGCVQGVILMHDYNFRDEYLEYLADDPDVVNAYDVNVVYSESTMKFLDTSGTEHSSLLYFLTMDDHDKLEKLLLDSSKTEQEILEMDNFILLPYYAKFGLGFKEGDTFTILDSGKKYDFKVAGFFESGFNSNFQMLQFIVSNKDQAMLKRLLESGKFICYETSCETDEAVYQFFARFNAHVDECYGTDVQIDVTNWSYYDEKDSCTMSIGLLMNIMIAMASVIFISVAFIIRFRIKNEIDDQLVSIGVLEALGYKSGEISLSYMAEYLMIAVPAVVCGLLLNLVTSPALLRVGEMTIGHRAERMSLSPSSLLVGAVILAAVGAISYLRAVRIRRIPPVVAFRKGTADHTHRRAVLPLNKTKASVHMRLAAKGFFADLKTNIGMGACISISVIALIVCFVLYDYVGVGSTALLPQCGVEAADLQIRTMPGTDIDAFAEDVSQMSEVKRVSVSNDYLRTVIYVGSDQHLANVFADYSVTENIIISSGRFPKHENEVAIHKNVAKKLKAEVGDTITLSSTKFSADYVVCGIVDGLFEMVPIDLTDDGYRRIEPSYSPYQLYIYLNDGTELEAFRNKLFEVYGAPAEGFDAGVDASGSLDERIRAEADQKISAMLDMYGVNHIDYAIQIDGVTIKGSSSRFKIKSASYGIRDLFITLDSILNAISLGTGAFMVISSLMIVTIVFLVVHSSVKRQRTELGIMKGMGYTSRELMMQTAAKLIPILVFAVTIGSIAGVIIGKIVYSKYGELNVVTGKVILLSLAVILLGMAVAYFSARRIKNISVYELMQE